MDSTTVKFFNPETVRTMSTAFDLAWQQIAEARHPAMIVIPADVRERIALAIIKEARKGMTDPGRLVAVAMAAALPDYRLQPKSEQRIAS